MRTLFVLDTLDSLFFFGGLIAAYTFPKKTLTENEIHACINLEDILYRTSLNFKLWCQKYIKLFRN